MASFASIAGKWMRGDWRPWLAASLLLVTAAVAAAQCLVWCSQTVARFGTSLPVSTAVLLAVTGGVIVGLRWRPLFRSTSPGIELAILHLILAVVAVANPWFFRFACWGLAGETLAKASPVSSCFFLTLIAGATAGLPICLLCRLLTRTCVATCRWQQKVATPILLLLTGAGLGLAVCALWLIPALGTFAASLIAAAVGGVTAMLLAWKFPAPVADMDAVPAASEAASTASLWQPSTWHPLATWRPRVCRLAAAVLLGGLFVVVVRIERQLVPASIYTVCAEWMSLLAGVGLACCVLRFCQRKGYSPDTARLVMSVGSAAALLCGLALYPQGLQLSLWESATFSRPPILAAGRALFAIFLVGPIGLAWGAMLGAPELRVQAAVPGGRSLVAMFAVGCGLLHWSGLLQTGPEVWLVALAWGVAILAVAGNANWNGVFLGWQRRSLAAGLLLLLTGGTLFSGNYDPAGSAKILFATNSFVAYRNGVRRHLLPVLDEGRLISTVDGRRGTYTFWQYGAYQVQMRENGIPKGMVSTAPRLFPQFSGELLPAAVPLALHEHPERVLLLGLGSGATLASSLAFPVQQVLCVEGDRSFVDALRSVTTRSPAKSPLQDERVRLLTVDPPLAVRGLKDKYDVIISLPDQCSLLQSQACYTAEYLRDAARRLTTSGLFCQRYQTIDVGPAPLRQAVATLQSVFREVLMMDIAPGEVLLIGTNSPQGLLRPKLAERLQTEHSRKLLSHLGADWSVLLNVTAYSHTDLAKLTAGAPVAVNSAVDSRLLCLQPREVMRWGAKPREIAAVFSPRAGRLANWIGEEGQSPELVRRLAEVKGQQRLMTKYGDQYWAYRASVRDQLTSVPKSRSVIQQVNGEASRRAGMSSSDRQRIRYFSALGHAVKSHSLEDIRYMAEFAAPYDPLLTYFIHQEVAELYTQVKPRPVQEELQYRLYSIYYSAPQDSSLRLIMHTLRLLREHPSSEPDPQRRWDIQNSLLQILQRRWEARIGVSPKSAVLMLGEIDTSILATEQTFAVLDELAAEAGISAEYWTARKESLERSLVRPLQGYREQMLPHHHRAKVREHLSEQKQAETAPDPEPIVEQL